MVQKLEAIKDGGGSIRVGTTGTICDLMTRELENTKPATTAPVNCHDKPRTMSIPVSVPCSATAAKRLQTRKSLDEGSSSGTSSSSNRRSPETHRKMKNFPKSTNRIPMLGSDNVTLDRTPSGGKPDKRRTSIVEIVDIKCSIPDRAWASPITTKLKKFGFSKLSESMV